VHVGPLIPASISVFTALVFARLAWEGRRWAWVISGLFFGFGTAVPGMTSPWSLPGCVLRSSFRAVRRRDIGGPRRNAGALRLGTLALTHVECLAGSGFPSRAARGSRHGSLSPRLFFQGLVGVFGGSRFLLQWMSFFGTPLLVRSARIHAKSLFLLASCAIAWVWCLYLLLHGDDAVTAAMTAFLPLFAFLVASVRNGLPGSFGWAALIALALATGGLSLLAPRGPASGFHRGGTSFSNAGSLPASERKRIFHS